MKKAVLITSLSLAISFNALAGKSQDECIKLAANLGYKDEHCAAHFINVCKTATSKSEVNQTLYWDKRDGILNLRKCGPKGNPNGTEYSADWARLVGNTDSW